MPDFSQWVRLLTGALALGFGASQTPAAWAANQALLIGIDDYKSGGGISGLSGAVADATALAKTLKDVSPFEASNVRLLTSVSDTKPSKAVVLAAVDDLARKAAPGDTVFVSYSGHGVWLDGVSYLVAWDTVAKDAATLRATALSSDEIKSRLSRLPDVTLVMAFDMCRNDPLGSRSVTSGADPSRATPLSERQARDLVLVNDDGGPKRKITLFACSPREKSWESEREGRGYFSAYLERGLRGAAANSAGAVTLSNLILYLECEVPRAVREATKQKQTPWSVIDGAELSKVTLSKVSGPAPGGDAECRPQDAAPPRPPYNPRVAVLLPERLLGAPNAAPIAEAELIKALQEAGFNLVKPASSNADAAAQVAAAPDPQAARDLGAKLGCDILITGEANADAADDSLGFKSAQAQVTLSAFYADTGELLATAAGDPTPGASTSQVAAARTALKNAVAALNDPFVTQLNQGIAAHEGEVTAQVSGLSGIADLNRVMSALQRTPGVGTVSAEGFDAVAGTARLSARSYYPASRLASDLATSAPGWLRVDAASGRSLRLTLPREPAPGETIPAAARPKSPSPRPAPRKPAPARRTPKR